MWNTRGRNCVATRYRITAAHDASPKGGAFVLSNGAHMDDETVVPMPRACQCGWKGQARTYDIGSGPEWSCPQCERCYGALGQPLQPMRPEYDFSGGIRGKDQPERMERLARQLLPPACHFAIGDCHFTITPDRRIVCEDCGEQMPLRRGFEARALAGYWASEHIDSNHGTTRKPEL